MKIYSICVLLFLSTTVISQNTFSKVFHFGYPSVIFTGLVSTDSCTYVSGTFLDSIPTYKSGIVFIKFNLEGEELDHLVFLDSLYSFTADYTSLIKAEDDYFISAGTLGGKIMYMKYNTNGDTAFIRTYDVFPNFVVTDFKYNPIDTTYTFLYAPLIQGLSIQS